jgi:hypothetical protein
MGRTAFAKPVGDADSRQQRSSSPLMINLRISVEQILMRRCKTKAPAGGRFLSMRCN